jgi:TRAP-type uncharacterized transport system substrate-binding protein
MILIITVLLYSCNNNNNTIKFAVGTKKGTKYFLLRDIAAQLNKQNIKSEVILCDEAQGDGVIEALRSKKADFAILENDFSNDTTINLFSVLPLYPSIVLFLYNSDTIITDIDDLIRGNKVSLYLKEHDKTHYAQNLLKEFGISNKDYYPIYNTADNNLINDTVKVCFYLTGYDNTKVIKMMNEGNKIYSFDDFNLAYKGSSVDAFCIKHIYSYPFIVPKNLFGNYPDVPILTIAVDAVLVARPDLDADLVNKITKLIVE